MRFTQTGTFRKNTLEELTTLKQMERIDNILLDKLDYIVRFVAKEKSEIITDYVKNLTKKYQDLVEEDFLINSSNEIAKKFAKFKNLNQYPELNKASLNYFFHLLQLKE